MSSVIYYLKKIYNKNKQSTPMRFFLNSRSSDLMFFYTNVTTNGVLIDDISNNLLTNYIKAKKTKNALSRFVYLCKVKKAKKSVQYDLYFNSLDIIKPHQKIELFLNNTIYYFRLSDIINIWVSCLTKCENMFCSPIKIKNPYTNIEFDYSSLHNIYQSLLCSHFQIPKWIVLFYECDFDLVKFSYDNYPTLKELAINDFMVNGSLYEKYENICNMMHEYRTFLNYTTLQTPLTIREKRKIVEKLSPYLKNYLFGEYSCHPLKRKRCKNLAKRGLKNYFNDNNDIQTYRQLPISLLSPSLSEWSGESRLSRRITEILNESRSSTTSMPPPPPPPQTLERSTVRLNTREINRENNENTNNNVNSRNEISPPRLQLEPNRTPNRIGNYRNGSLFNLNLNQINSTNSNPFRPSFTLNRTPRRRGSNLTNSNFNMRMFNR